MGLIDLIEKVREKAEMTRRRILVGSTFTLTALIFFFWLSVKLYTAEGPTPADLGVKEAGPISQAVGTISDIMQSVGQKVDSVKKMLSGSTTTEENAQYPVEIE